MKRFDLSILFEADAGAASLDNLASYCNQQALDCRPFERPQGRISEDCFKRLAVLAVHSIS
ncbi:hypothetical protein [Rhizobium deserti]|uniref:hypothetical protein n=1 Tax=Rhizobium deserti TaxID=2547961 RepID=UPI001FDEEBB5|nr:hypothetical protein [Rhizobium deserti]